MRMLKSVSLILILCGLCGCQLLVPAPAPLELKVMSYNIHIGKGMDGELDLNRIAEVINAEEPDLVALQEVDRFTERSGEIDELAILKMLTGLHGVYGKSIDFQGGEYGLATLSRYPIFEHRMHRHPVGEEEERRGFLYTVIAAPGQKVALVNTHLGLVSEDRRVQLETLRDFAQGIEYPLIIAGDFNELPAGENWQAFKAAFTHLSPDRGELLEPTHPAGQPVRRLDYVWGSRDWAWEVLEEKIVPTLASDHLPVVVKVELPSN